MISFKDHFVQDDFYHTAAYEMTDTQFKVKCKCKKGYHVFGNGGDALSNRTEYRSSHCLSVKPSYKAERKITGDATYGMPLYGKGVSVLDGAYKQFRQAGYAV